jgi:hypothetical protein
MKAHHTIATLFIAALVNACCDTCPDRGGSTVEFIYTETSGDCGPIYDQIVSIDRQPNSPAEAGCSDGAITYSNGNCTVRNTNVRCPTGEPGVDVIQTGIFEWDCDGDMTGTLTLQFVDNLGTLCKSTYDIEAETLSN